MTGYEELLTTKLSNETSIVETSGISTEKGIYGQLRNGNYIKPIQSIFLPIVEDDIKNVTIAISLVKILRTLVSTKKSSRYQEFPAKILQKTLANLATPPPPFYFYRTLL
jgi:hypothetical protein